MLQIPALAESCAAIEYELSTEKKALCGHGIYCMVPVEAFNLSIRVCISIVVSPDRL